MIDEHDNRELDIIRIDFLHSGYAFLLCTLLWLQAPWRQTISDCWVGVNKAVRRWSGD